VHIIVIAHVDYVFTCLIKSTHAHTCMHTNNMTTRTTCNKDVKNEKKSYMKR